MQRDSSHCGKCRRFLVERSFEMRDEGDAAADHTRSLRPRHEEHEFWSQESQEQRHHPYPPTVSGPIGKGVCHSGATLLRERPRPTWSQVHRSHDHCTLRLRKPLEPRRSCFRDWDGVGIKRKRGCRTGTNDQRKSGSSFQLSVKANVQKPEPAKPAACRPDPAPRWALFVLQLASSITHKNWV